MLVARLSWTMFVTPCTPSLRRFGARLSSPIRDFRRSLLRIVGTGLDLQFASTRCLIPGFDGALFSREWKDALWARFCAAAPQRQRRSVERYNIVKRA